MAMFGDFTDKGGFIKNLPKIYGIYTGGFIAFIILMAIFEQLGVSEDTIGLLFVGFTIVIYAAIGWLSRTMQLDAYYVAGRQVPPVFNGMATGADWMSGASFVAMAGGIYMGGHAYLAFVVGWTGGYVLVATLMAPYLRKFGCYTVPDFIGTRYGGNFARFCAVVVLVVASFTYVTAQINATGTIASRALQIPFGVGVWIALVAILLCSMLGGTDHRLPGAGDLDVEQAGLRGDSAARVRRRGGAARRAGDAAPGGGAQAGGGAGRGECAGGEALGGGGRLRLEGALRHAGGVHDARDRLAATHPDALLHDALGA